MRNQLIDVDIGGTASERRLPISSMALPGNDGVSDSAEPKSAILTTWRLKGIAAGHRIE